jgi:hypothetical protein
MLCLHCDFGHDDATCTCTNSAFHRAAFYCVRARLEQGLSARSPEEAIEEYLADGSSPADVEVVAFNRRPFKLEACAHDLVERLTEIVCDDPENSGPDGDWDPLKFIDQKALEKEIAAVLARYSAAVSVWHCDEVACQWYSTSEVTEIEEKLRGKVLEQGTKNRNLLDLDCGTPSPFKA